MQANLILIKRNFDYLKKYTTHNKKQTQYKMQTQHKKPTKQFQNKPYVPDCLELFSQLFPTTGASHTMTTTFKITHPEYLYKLR